MTEVAEPIAQEPVEAENSSALVGVQLSDSLPVEGLAYAQQRKNVEALIGTEAWQKVSWMESRIEAHPESYYELPLKHIFTPGLYCRQIFMPKGALLTSRIHLTEHPYFVLEGVVSVWDDADGWVLKKARDEGITKPGTRRILLIHEDCVWMTCHANPSDEKDPEKIVESVTFDHRRLRELEEAAR